jgi:hypothetical protein
MTSAVSGFSPSVKGIMHFTGGARRGLDAVIFPFLYAQQGFRNAGKEGIAFFELYFLDAVANELDLHLVQESDDTQRIGFQYPLVGCLVGTVIQHHFPLVRIDMDDGREYEVVAVVEIAGRQGVVVFHRPQDGCDPFFRENTVFLVIVDAFKPQRLVCRCIVLFWHDSSAV